MTSTPYLATERLTTPRSNLGEMGLMVRTRELYALPELYWRPSEPWRLQCDPANPKNRIANTPGVKEALGFAWSSHEWRGPTAPDGSWAIERQRIFAVPHWFAAVLLAQAPAAWWRRRRKKTGGPDVP